jgi:hypothetical protein
VKLSTARSKPSAPICSPCSIGRNCSRNRRRRAGKKYDHILAKPPRYRWNEFHFGQTAYSGQLRRRGRSRRNGCRPPRAYCRRYTLQSRARQATACLKAHRCKPKCRDSNETLAE